MEKVSDERIKKEDILNPDQKTKTNPTIIIGVGGTGIKDVSFIKRLREEESKPDIKFIIDAQDENCKK